MDKTINRVVIWSDSTIDPTLALKSQLDNMCVFDLVATKTQHGIIVKLVQIMSESLQLTVHTD